MRAGLLAVLLALVAAAPAAADQIVFACGDGYANLCRARPDGTGLQQLTTGGDATRATDSYYRAPAITRDGRTLAYVFESDVFLRGRTTLHATVQFSPLLIRFRPDGARFAVAELSAVTGGTQVCTYNGDLSGTNEGRYCLASGVSSGMDYLPDGRLLMSRSGGTATAGRTVISLLRPEDGGPTGVERTLVDDPAFDLESPSVSPDGTQVAVVQAPVGSGTEGKIAIYDLATGALVRTLTDIGHEAAPVFSPDGRRIAFESAGAVWVTSATGRPGSERHIAATGRSPAWGGGTIPRAFTRLELARRHRDLLVRGRLRVARKGARVLVEAFRGGRRAGRFTRRSAKRGVLKFAVAVGRPGRFTLRITVTPPGRGPDTATRTVRVSR
jgi:Tol biopolymer transport system component